MKLPRMHRRSFLKRAGVAFGGTLAAVLAPSVWSAVPGANGDIRVAIIGLGNKGKQHIEVFSQLPGVRLVAICDVDPKRLAEQVEKLKGRNLQPIAVTDARRILERDDIDAVVVSAPNHWHALFGIWACQAGKDVYVEKPISHTIAEGEALLKAAKKHQRIMQSGTQYRSDVGLRAAAAWLGEGPIGRPKWGHVVWFERRDTIGRVAPYTPRGLDYDLYCGPSALAPLTRTNLHYDWHWVWSTGNGDLANSGIHAFDVCRWFAGEPGFPRRTRTIGGRFAWDDAGQTPNTSLTLLEFPRVPMMIEIRNLPQQAGLRAMDTHLGIREGIALHFEGGRFVGLRGGGVIYDNDGKRVRDFAGDGGAGHAANFIKAVRSRRAEELQAPLAEGHASSSACELGTISWRLGRAATVAECREAVGAHPGAAEALAALEKNVVANDVSLERQPFALGPSIEYRDSRIQSVTGGKRDALDRARALARGAPRKPYEIPYL